MTNPFDTGEAYQALVKIGKPDLMVNLLDPGDDSARAEAIVAMMDWLEARHERLVLEHQQVGPERLDVCIISAWDRMRGDWAIYEQAPTRAEALIAAVNATEEKT